MPENFRLRFVVSCKDCRGTLVTAERLRAPEIAVLEDHLRVCCHSEPLPERAPLGEILARVRVDSVPS